MKLISNPYFMVTVLVQILGPFFFSFGDWDNVIQYISGFGMAYAFFDFFVRHKREMKQLHEKIDLIHEHIRRGRHEV